MFTKVGTAPFSLAVMLIGALTPLAFAIAAFSDGYWTFNINTLSDLGISSDDFARNLFTATCIIGGACTAFFGYGKLMLKHGLDAAGGFILVIGGVFLIAVGIFDETTVVHNYVAMGYFIMAGVAMFVSLFADYQNKRFLTLSATIVALCITFGSMPGFTIAGVEVISVVAICMWTFCQGLSFSFSKDINKETDNGTVTE